MTPFLWIMAGGFLLGIALLIVFNVGNKHNPIGTLVAIAISIVCAGSFVFDISINPYKNGYTPPTEEVKTASFAEIHQAYEENELVADDLYRGNRYQVTGKIMDISSGGVFNAGGATLTLVVETVVVIADFKEDQLEDVKTVKVGDTVTFIGECLSSQYWDKCELVQN